MSAETSQEVSANGLEELIREQQSDLKIGHHVLTLSADKPFWGAGGQLVYPKEISVNPVQRHLIEWSDPTGDTACGIFDNDPWPFYGKPWAVHGTVYAHDTAGCRCEHCVAAKRDHNQRQNIRRPSRATTTMTRAEIVAKSAALKKARAAAEREAFLDLLHGGVPYLEALKQLGKKPYWVYEAKKIDPSFRPALEVARAKQVESVA